MSREILFRGKCNITNEWVFGLYGMTLTKRHYIDSIFKNMLTHTIIDFKTICQYTGLKDKNGVKIFEGDILNNKEIVVFEDGSFNIKSDSARIVLNNNIAQHLLVIGNIHDNE